jgi:hypothetical protein
LTTLSSIGPGTVDTDRVDYVTAITESWKRQMLLNVVKLRYADPPIFVDVGSIIAGYSLETSVTVGLGDQDTPLGPTDSVSFGGAGRFTDRPTITYVPLTGSAFMSNLITPIPPVSLFSAIQAGWNADVILRIGIGAINGIANEHITASSYFPGDPRFLRIVELMRELQDSGALAIRVDRGQGGAATLLALPNLSGSGRLADSARELRDLLQLEPGRTEFSLVFGRNSSGGHEIAVQSRSLMNVLQIMSSQAVVPEQHVREGRASPMADNPDPLSLPGFKILSAQEKPDATYAALRYRDTWFYVDDTDLQSKRVFSLIMLLFTLADSSPERAAPVVTIPAQ